MAKERKLQKIKSKTKADDIELLEENETKVVKKRLRFRFRSKHKFGKIELTFCIISLLFIGIVGFYYLGRGFYFYSLQHKHFKETESTLNGLVMSNNRIVTGDTTGLHQDEDGYFFRGNVENNYVWFANRMFRIVRINNDDSVKVVAEDNGASFMWGEDSSYDKSNARYWLTPVENNYSGVYFNTIPNPNKYIINTKYTIDKLVNNKVARGDVIFEDKVSLLSLDDYIQSGGKSGYLNNNKLYFLLGYKNDNDNIYVEEDGSITDCFNYDGYGIRPVITFVKNLSIASGNGSKDNPFIVSMGKEVNYVDSYVKLGNDIWKVYEEKDGILKMYLNGYITNNGEEVVRPFSNTNARFDYYSGDNIGHYLLFEYYENLPYKDVLVDTTFNNGEIGSEAGYSINNYASQNYVARITMLNLFDYVSNNELSDFYRNNNGSEYETAQYSVLSNGLLEDTDVNDAKHIVPVVVINSNSIKKGNGGLDDPYIIG